MMFGLIGVLEASPFSKEQVESTARVLQSSADRETASMKPYARDKTPKYGARTLQLGFEAVHSKSVGVATSTLIPRSIYLRFL